MHMKQCLILIFLFMNMTTLNSQPISKHQWKDRLILLFSNTPENAAAVEQLALFKDNVREMKERDLLIYRIHPEQVIGPDKESKLNTEWFYKYYKVGKDEFNVILIGKDGGEKLRSEALIPPEKIFELIDSMPMRRAEMRRQKKGI